MCGELSTRRRMKSVSDPCIKDDTARKNATPSTIPDSDTMLWRGRASRCLSAIAGASPSPIMTLSAGVARRVDHRPDRLPGFQSGGRGREDAVLIGQTGEDFDFVRPLGADRNVRWREL